MALKLYRGHRDECEGGHLEYARSGEFEEGRRGWTSISALNYLPERGFRRVDYVGG